MSDSTTVPFDHDIKHYVSADGLTLRTSGKVEGNEDLVFETVWHSPTEALINLDLARAAHEERIRTSKGTRNTGLKDGSQLFAKRFKPVFGVEMSVGTMRGCAYDEMSIAFGFFKVSVNATPNGVPILKTLRFRSTRDNKRFVLGIGGVSNANFISFKKLATV